MGYKTKQHMNKQKYLTGHSMVEQEGKGSGGEVEEGKGGQIHDDRSKLWKESTQCSVQMKYNTSETC